MTGGQGDDAEAPVRPEHRHCTEDGAHRGFATGIVAVETEDGFIDQTPHPFDLRFGQRGAERGNDFKYAGACQRDGVHIAFDRDETARLA